MVGRVFVANLQPIRRHHRKQRTQCIATQAKKATMETEGGSRQILKSGVAKATCGFEPRLGQSRVERLLNVAATHRVMSDTSHARE